MCHSVLEGIASSRRDFARQLQGRGLLPTSYDEAEVEQQAVMQFKARKGDQANAAGKDAGRMLYSHGTSIKLLRLLLSLLHNVSAAAMDAFSDNARVVKAAIAAGLYPNLLRVDAPPPRFQQVAGGTVEVPADPSKIKLFDRTKGLTIWCMVPASTTRTT